MRVCMHARKHVISLASAIASMGGAMPVVLSMLQHVMAAHLSSCALLANTPVYADEYLFDLDSSYK